MSAHRWLMLAALCALDACRTDQTLVAPDPHLQRMLEQAKRLPYQEDPILPGGMAMQKPPDGTVPTATTADNALVSLGAIAGHWAERIPIPVDRALVENGRKHFDTFCAPCHGVLADGVSVVADQMALRRPPNLHDERIRAYPPGRVFQTIREGYGLMPSYAVQLSVRDAWGVVGYVRALELARGVQVADLPPDVRTELAKDAP